MVRLLDFYSQSRLTNRNICGIDTEFCYPFYQSYEVAFYFKLPAGDWDLFQIGVYNANFETLLYSFPNIAQISEYFSWIIAKDSNGDNFLCIRQIKPLYNYDGVQPEITCYSMGIDVINTMAETKSLVTEDICSIAKYDMQHYVIIGDPNDVLDLSIFVTCVGETVSTEYTYNTLPLGWWIELTGPYIDLFMPVGCVLDNATIQGYAVSTSDAGTMEFGAQTCNSFVTLSGNGTYNYDCKGKYFGVIDPADITDSNLTNFLLIDGHLDISLFPMSFPCSQVKTLANKLTPKKVGTCYTSHYEGVNRYKVDTNSFFVPYWYVEEINIISATQAVYITGTNSIVDDYDTLIPVIQSDEYGWKERQGSSNFFLMQLYFETCTCFVNFIC